MTISDRVWLHTAETERLVVAPNDVYLLEADGDDTWVRFAGRRRVRDVRELSEVFATFVRFDFRRIHQAYAVNGRRVQRLRKRSEGQDWELKLEPPVNHVLPVSRAHLDDVRRAYGEP